MRALCVSTLVLAALFTLPSKAADAPVAPSPSSSNDATGSADRERLDSLFRDLKRESVPERAETIAARIEAEWLRSGGPTVELLMRWAGQARIGGNRGAALDLLEQVMVLAPGYAESYNARATMNFQRSEYARSLADIEQTLGREPRHFGALMGFAAILEAVGRDREALDLYRRVLAIYPALREAQDAFGRLAAADGERSL